MGRGGEIFKRAVGRGGEMRINYKRLSCVIL